MDESSAKSFPHPDLETLRAQNAALRTALDEARRHFVPEEILHAFFDLASVGMVCVDPHGLLVKVNQAYCQITGYALDELVGRPVLDLTHPDDRPAEAARFQLYLHRQDGAYVAEKRYLRKDGAVRWVNVHARFVHDENGRPRFSLGVIEDISDRKLAENALRQGEAHRQVAHAIEIERQRLHAVLDLLPAYVVLLSSDCQLRFANRYFKDRFGQSNSHSFFQHVSHGGGPCPHCEAFTPFQTHQPHHWGRACSDGRHYDIYDFPFTNVDGANLVLEVGIDVTETKHAQAALQHLNDTLEKRVADRTSELLQANEELSRFNRAAVNRELRMIDLKNQINRLCLQAGQAPLFAITTGEGEGTS